MMPIARWARLSGVLLFAAASGCAPFVPRPLSAQRSIETFRARSLQNPHLRAFLAANHVAPPGLGGRWGLKALTLTAMYYQPALAEARARLLVAQAAQITAAERPNPSLAVGPGYDRGVAAVPSPWIVPIALDWPLETAGRRGDRMALALHEAAMRRWDLIGTVWRVRSDLRAGLLRLFAARRTAQLLARETAALKRTLALLQGQLAAGNVSSFEVTQARIALDKAVLARQATTGQVRQARIALAGALGVPPRALLRVRLSFAQFTEFPRDLTQPQMRRQALIDRADVRAALEQYAASQSALQLQIARQWPDIDLGPGFTWNGQLAGDSEWQLGLRLTLPVLNHNQGPIAEARTQRRWAAAHFLAVQAAAINEIDGARAAYRSALRQLATAESLERALLRRLRAVRSQVAAGESPPLDLSTAEVAFDSGAREELNAQVHAQAALGRLEDALQSPLTLAPSTLRAAQAPNSRVDE